jgi:glutaminase-like protein
MPAPVSLPRARQLFDLCNARICCPCSTPAPCIPFLFPDDGCWGRAHEMCRLMIADGAQPEKVWIEGNLQVSSHNKPNCIVQWGWHVAPTLVVDVNGTPATYVIDPSLFNAPVPLATWKGVQGDPSATLTPSGADIFYLWGGQTDPTYSQTNTVLTTYRTMLRLRSAGSDGPPPYTNCVATPGGTQWFGLIEGNQTQLWFSWGWPAELHMVWHVMPLTPCPGGAQLTWDVAVERASASHATYWITVTNLSADRVRFAGRYNVLS